MKLVSTALFLSLITYAPGVRADYIGGIGRVMCQQGSMLVPVPHVEVMMMDASPLGGPFDTWLDTTYTASDGTFFAYGYGGDQYPDAPDPYFRIMYTDEQYRFLALGDAPRVRVVDDFYYNRGDDEPHHNRENWPSGFYNFGDILVGGTGARSDCMLFRDAVNAYDEYQTLVHERAPVDQLQVVRFTAVVTGRPYTMDTQIKWPTNWPSSDRAMRHEFAHTVRDALDGDNAHWNWDDTRFVYGRYHNVCTSAIEGFSFHEGWAEYWADTPGCTTSSHIDPTIEGDVADMLRELAACAGVGKPEMVAILRDNRGAIHSFGEFRDRFVQVHPQCGDFHSSAVIDTTTADPVLALGARDGDNFLFLRGTDNLLRYRRQDLSGAWSGSVSLGGPQITDSIAVAHYPDHRLVVFARATDNSIRYLEQTSTGWGEWRSMPAGQFLDFAVGENLDGRLGVFGRGTDQILRRSFQNSVGGTFGSWWNMSTSPMTSPPAVARDSGGLLNVFVAGPDYSVWTVSQYAPNYGFGAWSSIGGGLIYDLAAIRDVWGWVLVFDRSYFGHAQKHVYGWEDFGDNLTSTPVVSFGADGGYDVNVRLSDGRVWHKNQSAPYGTGGWIQRGQPGVGRPAVGIGTDGRTWVFSRTGASELIAHSY